MTSENSETVGKEEQNEKKGEKKNQEKPQQNRTKEINVCMKLF